MATYLHVHPVNPQRRLLSQAAAVIDDGGVIVYPTDSSYAVGCNLGEKGALERIRLIRRSERGHEFTLVCRDLSEIASYARVDNWAYRLIKSLTPGAYTFILRATSEVPKRVQDRRRTIGIRVPDNAVALELLDTLGGPIMSSTLILPGDDWPMTDPDEINDRIGSQVDLILDGGAGGLEPTTVVDLSGGEFTVVRQGKGDVSAFTAS
jgi:tRNA threonylcarbamoyl adenosine modification protein (Sua5/YciO/YrdC/YwlC family)